LLARVCYARGDAKKGPLTGTGGAIVGRLEFYRQYRLLAYKARPSLFAFNSYFFGLYARLIGLDSGLFRLNEFLVVFQFSRPCSLKTVKCPRGPQSGDNKPKDLVVGQRFRGLLQNWGHGRNQPPAAILPDAKMTPGAIFLRPAG
jgi:hypothetical protein